MTDDEILEVNRAAGVTPDEMKHDPEHGWLISPSALRKLIAIAPDTAGKFRLLKQLTTMGIKP